MANIKLLIAATDMPPAEKGDVVEVVGSNLDWGLKTVAPSWIRLTVTGVPGDQQSSENKVRDYLSSWGSAFKYSKVVSPTPGKGRYRIDLSPELDSVFTLENKIDLRNAILAETEGEVISQSKRHLEIETSIRPDVNDIEAIVSQYAYRRYRFPDSMIDAVLRLSVSGEPSHFTRSYDWVTANIIDKLRQ